MGGHIIIRSQAKAALTDPLVHGSLPTAMRDAIDQVFLKEEGNWTHVDCVVVGHAFTWAMLHQ